jgi:hypothetical protein
MPRPRVNPDKKLTEQVYVLLTKVEREAVDKARKGRPVSEWIRETILPFLRAWLR